MARQPAPDIADNLARTAQDRIDGHQNTEPRSDSDTDLHDRAHPDGQAPAEQDNVLESLGKAIIAPVKNTADPDNDPTTR